MDVFLDVFMAVSLLFSFLFNDIHGHRRASLRRFLAPKASHPFWMNLPNSTPKLSVTLAAGYEML
jgi:hypothetical protein